MDKETFKKLRKEYTAGELSENTVKINPFDQFTVWFNEMLQTTVPEPNAMMLATADLDGNVSARIVLLKAFSEAGLTFYTNYSSRKGQQLQANPKAALLFYWGDLQRQVRLEGQITKLSREDSQGYFRSRPVESQLGAVASSQSEELDDRETLEIHLQKLRKEFSGKDIPLPETWGGYILQPDYFEFWQGRKNRLHDRIYYRLIEDQWQIGRLYP
ncbi:MAG: pyridoxamine 5'-phosphate oxidase [Calditrichia bacterium]